MLILRDTISTFKRSKALAIVRSDFPFLAVAVGLVPGQLTAFWLYSYPLSLPGVLLVAVCAALALRLLDRSVLVLIVSFSLGLFSQWISLKGNSAESLSEERPYLGIVDDEPRRRRSGEVEVSIRLQEAGQRARVLCRGAELPWRNMSEAREGDRFWFNASFHGIKAGPNPFSYNATLLRRGYSASCRLKNASPPLGRSDSGAHRIRETISQRVTEVLGEGARSGILLSMAFGVRDVLSREAEAAFKETGLAHLLVFSGYQVMLVYHSILGGLGLLLWLSGGILQGFWLRLSLILPLSQIFSWVALPFSIALVWLCGIEGSSLRAAIAVVVFAVGRLLERGGGMLNSILFSFTILNLIWPGCWCEPGIELTFAALLGICCGAVDKQRHWLVSYLLVCFYASLFTSIVVLGWFGTFSPAGFLLNLLAGPLASLIACNAGYVAVALLMGGIDASGWLLQACGYALELLMWAVRFISAQSWVCFEMEGGGKVLLMVALLMLVLRISLSRVREYLAERGLA